MTKNAFIAITGRPNVGKSSLTNFLVGEKISIVSEKPQTTRNRINGVLTKGDTQFVFIDTPGFLRPKTKLAEHMVKSVRTSVDDVDCAILMADVTKKISAVEQELIRSFAERGTQVVLILNKVDLLKSKADILPALSQYSALYDFEEVIPVSVKNRVNTDKILPVLEKFAVEGEHFFPDDIATDRTERFLCGEIIREKLMRLTGDELPYAVTVEIETYKDEPKMVRIAAAILVDKPNQKKMIIGSEGSKIKQVGIDARKDIEEMLGRKVFLELWVKVKKGWADDERALKSLGYMDKGGFD